MRPTCIASSRDLTVGELEMDFFRNSRYYVFFFFVIFLFIFFKNLFLTTNISYTLKSKQDKKKKTGNKGTKKIKGKENLNTRYHEINKSKQTANSAGKGRAKNF